MLKRRKSKTRKKDVEFLQSALRENSNAILEGPKKKKWSIHDLKAIRPQTEAQEEFFHAFFNNDHICAYGSAGTGKTYIAMYLALNEIVNPQTPQERIIIVRSVVPTRDVGFLPGDINEKISVYETPYKDICSDLVGRPSTYNDMKDAGIIEFMPTSFIRGLNWNNAIVIVEECQNMSFHEINSVVTRLGPNSRVIFTGDTKQTDLRPHESGIGKMLKIIENIGSFAKVEFTKYDIIRSGIVREWITVAEEFE